MPSSLKITLAAFASLTLLLLAVFAIRETGTASQPLQSATVLPTPLPLPEFRLLDQDGNPLTRISLRNRWTLVFFGFTHCPDICPVTLQQLAQARQRLAGLLPEETVPPDILLISVDPDRDTPETLKEYTGYFGPGAYGATGDPEALSALASTLGIFFARDDTRATDYNVSHSVAVLLLNDEAELKAIFSAPHSVDALVSDLQILMEAS
jgi:protein SCO1/2